MLDTSDSEIDATEILPDDSPVASVSKSAEPKISGRHEEHAGTTRRSQLAVTLKRQLDDLRKKFLTSAMDQEFDPLLSRLTEYHNKLSSEAESIVTEKLSAEVLSVLENPDIVDDVSRQFKWSKDDEHRLNQMNMEVKKLVQPQSWTWAAQPGTEQYKYNHARMKLAVTTHLDFVIIHCEQCKCTGILVGLDQIHSQYCYDCMVLNRTKDSKEKTVKIKAWEAVCPKTLDYPKCLDSDEFLPKLYPGDKAVITPVHPVVTIRKNYMANKQLRQECITLKQDPVPTWVSLIIYFFNSLIRSTSSLHEVIEFKT